MPIAIRSADDRRRPISRRLAPRHHRLLPHAVFRQRRQTARQIGNRHLHLLFHRRRLTPRNGAETNQIPGLELPHLPQLRLYDGRGTNKSSQARPVRPQNHRHVTREIHRPDSVSIVVDVRGMQPGAFRVQPKDGPSSVIPITSPARSTRPACPPNPPRIKVLRLSKYSGTFTPPEIARYARIPAPCDVVISSVDPAET